MIIKAAKSLKGVITVPGDKSISHRAIMFGAISKGVTRVSHFLKGADCLSTISCFQNMGITIEHCQEDVLVHGNGLHGLQKPKKVLDTGNSGTTTRLISGILAGQDFSCEINGDASIQSRPMGRIMIPLLEMGANIYSMKQNGCAPLQITPSSLRGIHYRSPVASAQVKSCILLAGLYAKDATSVTEPALSRNHTELMLHSFGATIKSMDTTATIMPDPILYGQEITVPGDISSAAYFLCAGLMVPNSEILLKNVGINPTRDGILHVCKQMGGRIEILNERTVAGEKTADLLVKSSTLTGTTIEGAIIPTLIDEIPMIAVLAAFADGTTIIKDAQELKVKESNRLDLMVTLLSSMGVDIEGTEDGMIIHGGNPLIGTTIDSHLDHRIAMSFAIAGLVARGETTIERAQCVEISYPGFYEDLHSILQ